jgi:hypothetical protein
MPKSLTCTFQYLNGLRQMLDFATLVITWHVVRQRQSCDLAKADIIEGQDNNFITFQSKADWGIL